MTVHVIVVDRPGDFRLADPRHIVVTARDYITRPQSLKSSNVRVINLSRDFSYLGTGYYVSLLAEAREEKVIPSVKTILDLSRKAIYKPQLSGLDQTLEKCLKRLPSPMDTLPKSFKLSIFFGKSDDARFQELADEAFDLFRCPLLEMEIKLSGGWHVASIEALSIKDIAPEQESLFQNALDAYTRSRWRLPKAPDVAPYDIAILHNPQEKLPPSSQRTLQKFVRIGKTMGVDIELIERKDFSRLAEFDALFIRETTALDDHTYRFAKQAESEGLVVIDDPNSILKCTNKVYLAELLKANRIPTPKTLILDTSALATVEQELRYPLVLKIPDGSFSRGVFKVNDRAELEQTAARLFEDSDIILAQEFMYTQFDWRVGLLNGEPIFACQYFMSKEHWQIVKHRTGGSFSEGDSRTLAVSEAPPEVVRIATKAARLIGNGLYGVDLKQNDKGIFVIEINDNPNLDMGVEDAVLKDDLYKLIIREFIRRIELQTKPRAVPGTEAAVGAAEPLGSVA